MSRKWLIPILIMVGVIVFSSHGLKGGPEVSVREAVAMLKSEPRPAVIDLRNRADYDEGHLPGAANVPIADFKTRLPKLTLSKTETVLLVGADDVGAREITKYLYDNGYQGALTLKGGIDAWRATGHALQISPTPKPQ